MLTGSLRHGRQHREHLQMAKWRTQAKALHGRRARLADWLGYRTQRRGTILGPATSIGHILFQEDGHPDRQVRALDEVVLLPAVDSGYVSHQMALYDAAYKRGDHATSVQIGLGLVRYHATGQVTAEPIDPYEG